MRRFFVILFWFICTVAVYAQSSFHFALVTDTHVGGATGAEDLRRTVADINQLAHIDFVILSGDVTEFGSDEELALAKQILDSLDKPLYVVPGNHDSNWSESGANTFREVFGGETFFFKHKGYHFMGTASGPNMRMSPGQVPRENLVWMDSIFAANPDVNTPLIFINHYPLDSSLNNWFDVTDRLLQRNTQLALCGHGHNNRTYNWDGIQGVMCRSNLRAKAEVGGYNIIHVEDGKATFQVRYPLSHNDSSAWLELRLAHPSPVDLIRPSYAVNDTYTNVHVAWTFDDNSDMGAGMARYKKNVIAVNTSGQIYSLDLKNGRQKWVYQTNGKIYATPAVWKDYVVVGSSDRFIYCLNAETGQLRWEIQADKAVLGSPVVVEGVAFIGASDGVFRAIDVKSGELVWTFNGVDNYVSGKPTFYDGKLIFGSWGNGFYALDKETGDLVWSWDNGHSNRMFSAAACEPVGANGRIFIVAPDRYMTALDVKTGAVVWREKRDSIRVRESMGPSVNDDMVYVKTMDGNLYGISTMSDGMDVVWQSELQLPYELAPSAIATHKNNIFVPSHSGVVSSVDCETGRVLWQHKVSNAMVNPILVVDDHTLVVSTMDGRIVRLDY